MRIYDWDVDYEEYEKYMKIDWEKVERQKNKFTNMKVKEDEETRKVEVQSPGTALVQEPISDYSNTYTETIAGSTIASASSTTIKMVNFSDQHQEMIQTLRDSIASGINYDNLSGEAMTSSTKDTDYQDQIKAYMTKVWEEPTDPLTVFGDDLLIPKVKVEVDETSEPKQDEKIQGFKTTTTTKYSKIPPPRRSSEKWGSVRTKVTDSVPHPAITQRVEETRIIGPHEIVVERALFNEFMDYENKYYELLPRWEDLKFEVKQFKKEKEALANLPVNEEEEVIITIDELADTLARDWVAEHNDIFLNLSEEVAAEKQEEKRLSYRQIILNNKRKIDA